MSAKKSSSTTVSPSTANALDHLSTIHEQAGPKKYPIPPAAATDPVLVRMDAMMSLLVKMDTRINRMTDELGAVNSCIDSMMSEKL